jgi:hypothetical protein
MPGEKQNHVLLVLAHWAVVTPVPRALSLDRQTEEVLRILFQRDAKAPSRMLLHGLRSGRGLAAQNYHLNHHCQQVDDQQERYESLSREKCLGYCNSIPGCARRKPSQTRGIAFGIRVTSELLEVLASFRFRLHPVLICSRLDPKKDLRHRQFGQGRRSQLHYLRFVPEKSKCDCSSAKAKIGRNELSGFLAAGRATVFDWRPKGHNPNGLHPRIGPGDDEFPGDSV